MLAGTEYGTGSSRDWAAKGTICWACAPSSPPASSASTAATWSGMGVLPLEFLAGQTWQSLGLTGEESYDIPRTRRSAAAAEHDRT